MFFGSHSPSRRGPAGPRDHLSRVAYSLLDLHWNRHLPVDPVVIARAAGARVLMNPELGQYAGWFHDDADGKSCIEFNGNQPLVRQRFAVAHELGHFALGHGTRPRDGAKEFSLPNYDPLEGDANRFAIELLMPSGVVNGLICKRGMSELSALANAFNTSTFVVALRLKNLGWL